MAVYVPTREEIVRRLLTLADVVRRAATLSEVERELTDELGALQLDVANRAGMEAGRIKGRTINDENTA